MARTVSLAKLRGLARLYADQRPGGQNEFIPDADLGVATTGSVNDLINLALTELYDLLVAARGHEYYLSSSAINIVAGTASYALPATFYQDKGVILEWNAKDHEPVDDYERVLARAGYANLGIWSPWSPKAYRLVAGNLEFVPTPTSAVTGRLRFIPALAPLTNDVDTFDGVNGWEKLVALRVAMEMRAVEERPFGDLQTLYAIERERIEAMKAEREAAHPKRVIDVCPEGVRAWPFQRRRDAS
jgi:hypothetical protein